MVITWGKSWCFQNMQLYETGRNPSQTCYIQLGILPFLHRQIWTSFPAHSLIKHRDESDMKPATLKDSYLMLYLGFGTDSPKEPKTFNHHFSREMVWIFKKYQCKVLSNCCTKALGCPQHPKLVIYELLEYIFYHKNILQYWTWITDWYVMIPIPKIIWINFLITFVYNQRNSSFSFSLPVILDLRIPKS